MDYFWNYVCGRSIPLDLTCNKRVKVVILPAAEATTIHVESEDLIRISTGSSLITTVAGTAYAALLLRSRSVEAW